MIELLVLVAVLVIAGFIAMSWYRVVPPSEAHFVVSPGKTMVCSSDEKIMTDLVTGKPLAAKSRYGGRWYFKIPVLRTVRKMDITIKELVKPMETYEKDQGRYNVKYSIKFRIRNVERAAETFVNDTELYQQLDEVVQAAVRAITVKYSVVDARANKRKMGEEIESEITDDLEKWGLELVNFVLVDFQDTGESKIISDISRRREVEINSETRQLNANRIQEARVKEAEAEQKARQREIEKDEAVAKREEDKKKAVAIQAKDAKDKELDVVKIDQVIRSC